MIAPAALLLSGCAAAAAAGTGNSSVGLQQPSDAAAQAANMPMEMITFGDRGYRASNIPVRVDTPVMFMFFNPGKKVHDFQAPLPLSDLHVATPDGSAVEQQPAMPVAVRVVPGQEVDVTFTPREIGRYPITVDGRPGGAVFVTSVAGVAPTRPASPVQVILVSPRNDAVIHGSTLHVVVRIVGGTLAADYSTRIAPTRGHVHLYLNDRLVSMSYGVEQDVTVHPGFVYAIYAEWVAEDHLSFSPRDVTPTTLVSVAR